MKTANRIKTTEKMKKYGRILVCPDCNGEIKVYHMRWCAITCGRCKAMIDKNKWLVKEETK